MSADDAKAKLTVLCKLLQPRIPAHLWTERTCFDAAARFKWVPSLAELVEFFDDAAARMRTARDRAEIVGRLPTKRPPEQRPGRTADQMSADERAELAARVMAMVRGAA
jgi:hypothetical protein